MERKWHDLEQDVKNALVQGSGIVQVINENLQATPQFILDLIKNKFPNIDIEKVKEIIQEVALDVKGAESIPGEDIHTTLENLQKYFAALGDKEWQMQASVIAQKLAALFAPGNTPYAIIVMFIEYAYQIFNKGK